MNSNVERSVWNPVLRRELLVGFRSPQMRWIVSLYLLVPFLVIANGWPSGAPYYGGSDLAVRIWESFRSTQLWLVILLTPIFAAYVVSAEFEQRTAEFLWTTLVPPPVVILSKMAAVVLLCSSLLVASLPALSLIFFLGGVDMRAVAEGYAMLVATMLCAASVAVCFSAVCRRGHVSLFFTYVMFLLLFVVGGIVTGKARGFSSEAVNLLIITFAFGALACLAGMKPVGERSRPNVKPIDDADALKRRRERWPYYIVDPLRRLPPLTDSANVLAVQEPRIHPLHRSGWGYRFAAFFAVPAMSLMIESIIDGREPHAYVALWWSNLVIGGVWTILLHAVSMTMEQELGTLDGLRLTRVRPLQVLFGKWKASWRMRWALMLMGVVSLVVANVYENRTPGAWLPQTLSWWVGMETIGLLTLAVASFCSRTMVAVALSLLASLVIISLPIWLEHETLWGDWFIPGLKQFHPSPAFWRPVVYQVIPWSVIGACCLAMAVIGTVRKWRAER